MRKHLIMAAALSMLLTIQGFAELVSRDDPVHGPDSITFDTDTGLEWLDLTKTTNLSFNSVTPQLVPGGRFEGFRYATIEELTTLFVHAGIPKISFGPGTLDPANYEPVLRLLGLVGATIPHGIQTFGFLGEASPFVPTNLAVGMLQAFSLPSPGVGSADPVQASNVRDSPFEIVGSFLVRLSPQRAVEFLLEEVEALVAEGTLTPNQGEALMDKLEAAIARLNRGNTRRACNRLEAFIRKANAFIRRGVLSPDKGLPLINAATAIRSRIGC